LHLWDISQHINIVSFDVPFPANYGGVIDVYYKLYQLKQQGVKIHLHCFKYGRAESQELNKLCEKVYYYPRNTSFLNQLSFLPYTVKSRINNKLKQNLLSNNYPILFEVLHTCYLLKDPQFRTRFKIYRHSNIEHDYYNELAKAEPNLLKKVYFKLEAYKLKKFERIINYAQLVLAVNKKDTDYFKANYPQCNVHYLPSFNPHNTFKSFCEIKPQMLFHGNLSVSENYNAALWFLHEVAPQCELPLIIAGLNPPEKLINKVKQTPNSQIIANPSEKELATLIQQSCINLLFTQQATGLKLKLLNVLFNSKFIICNQNMLEGTDIIATGGLFIANTNQEFINYIEELKNKTFGQEEILERSKQIAQFSNQTNIELLMKLCFNETAGNKLA
jgi:hypothetical protein